MVYMISILTLLWAFFPIQILGCMNCGYGTTFKMVTAYCDNRTIQEIPKCLKSGIEVLGLSFNRIRLIEEHDLERYTSLKFLYLSDNMISKIHEKAFESLTSLTTLDLSLNSLIELPSSILHLPSLRRFYLSQNYILDVVKVIEESKPITSPLEYLDISCNEVKKLPDLGIVPTLLAYNITKLKINNFGVPVLAGLCNLKYLHNDNFTADFTNNCDCWTVKYWMQEKDITYVDFKCPGSENACDYEFSEEDLATYAECKKRHEEIVLQSRLLKIAVPVCVTILVVILIVIFIIVRRRRRAVRKARRKILKNHSPIVIENKEEQAFIN